MVTGLHGGSADRHCAVQVLTDGYNLRVNCYVAGPEPESQLRSMHAPDNHQEQE